MKNIRKVLTSLNMSVPETICMKKRITCSIYYTGKLTVNDKCCPAQGLKYKMVI